MKIKKSYTLTPDQQKEVDEEVAKLDKKYSIIKDVIQETVFDAGLFFEHELDENPEE